MIYTIDKTQKHDCAFAVVLLYMDIETPWTALMVIQGVLLFMDYLVLGYCYLMPLARMMLKRRLNWILPSCWNC